MQILQLHVHDENLPHPKGALLKLRWLWRWLAYSEIIVIFKIKPELIWILWHINLVQAAIRRYTLCMDLVWSSAVLSEMLFCIHCMLKMVIWITAAFLSVQSRTVAHWIFSLFRLLSLKSRGGCVGESHQISSFWSFSPSSDNNHGMCKVPKIPFLPHWNALIVL